MHEFYLFTITFFAALVGVIPPGLVNMSIAKTCVDVDLKAGKQKAIGAAVIVFVQAFIAILIAKEIKKNPDFHESLLFIGIFVLSVMLVYFLISAIRQKTIILEQKTPKNKNFFIRGVVISSLNIFPIPYFVVLSTLFTPVNHIEFSIQIKLLFALSAALGSVTTFLGYVYFFDKIIKQNDTFKQYSNYFMAALMFCLLVITLLEFMDNTQTDFFLKVYAVVRQIPYGHVTTYGAIAKAIGAAKSARTVGYAMNASHQYDDIPAHRVVNRNGVLTGKHHFPGTDVMQQMLEAEGIEVVEDQIVNFQEYLWIPDVRD